MKIDRLLSILLLMLKKNKITAPELAAYFETSVRTIYRDIDALCMAGIPIQAEQGAHGGYSLMPGFTLDKQVFKVDELLSLIAGLKGLEGVFDDGVVRKTVEKVSSLAGPEAGAESLEINFFGWGEGSRVRNYVKALYKSIHEKNKIKFEYTNLKNQTFMRTAEPCKLFYRGSNWYLLAYCLKKDDYRFFRISRMQDLSVLPEFFVPRRNSFEGFEPVDEMAQDTEPEQLHLLISPEGAFKAKEYFASENYIVHSDGSVEVKVMYPLDEWVYSYLLGYCDTLTVLGSESVRNELLRRAKLFIQHNDNLTY